MSSPSDAQTLRYLQSENIRLKSENNAMRNYVERLQISLSSLVDLQKEIDAITSKTNIYLLIHQIVEAALNCVDSKDGSLMLLDEDTGELVFVEVIGEAQDRLVNKRLPREAGIAGWVMENRQAKMVADVPAMPHLRMSVNHYTGLDTKTMACVPLLDGDRRLGVIEVINTKTGRLFEPADLDMLQLVGRLASLALIAVEKASA
ncbi:MAG: GAF domain-containing protein [Anaerolineales bacterium]|nr:GAF domain-containing protein [Anaerolineales bacterium]